MNVAVILSAGSGTRFNKGNNPKQFFDLNGKPMLLYSLELFQEQGFIDGFVVVSREDLIPRTKELIAKFNKCLSVVEGGERRQDSVFNALNWIDANLDGCERVFIHDSARPFCSAGLIKKLHESSVNNKAVIPVLKSEDTLKELNGSLVLRTLDRNLIFRVQTPQVFDFKLLYECYNKFPSDVLATDDSSLLEHFGEKVVCIEGERTNIKVTYLEDVRETVSRGVC